MRLHRSNWRRHAGVVFIVSLVLAASAMRPTSAVADGALAVALPDDVVKKGFAYGYVTDYPDADKADAEALKQCRHTTIARRGLVRGAGVAPGGSSGHVEMRKPRRSRPPRRMRGRSFVV